MSVSEQIMMALMCEPLLHLFLIPTMSEASLGLLSMILRVPIGLEDVSKYPDLFAELIRRGWDEGDLEKLAGLNLIRVYKKAEEVNEQSFLFLIFLLLNSLSRSASISHIKQTFSLKKLEQFQISAT